MKDKVTTPATGQLLHDLFHEVFSLHQALSSVMDQVHEQAGMNTSQLKVIRALIHLGPATVPDIASFLGVSRQFVQTVTNSLLASAFLEMRPNPRHKRSRLIVLNESGRAKFDQTKVNESRIIEQSLPELDSNSVRQARNLLHELCEAVQHVGTNRNVTP